MLASLNSLNNKSGLNKKSVINNTAFEAYSNQESESSDQQPFLRSLYTMFWQNVPYLSNPFLLRDDLKDDNQAVFKKEKFLELIRNFAKLLDYFKNNPIEEEEPIIRRFPKYIKDINLFSYQINEPYFRKTVLVQLKFLLFNVENPLKVSGKQFESFSDTDSKEIKAFDDVVSFLLRGFKPFDGKPKKHLNDVVSRLLSSEKDWMRWKEDGCNPFSKAFDQINGEKFKNGEHLTNPEPVEKLVADKQRDIRSWLNLDKRFDHTNAYNRDYLSVELGHLDHHESSAAFNDSILH